MIALDKVPERFTYLLHNKTSDPDDWIMLTVVYFVACWVAHFASSVVSTALVPAYTRFEKEDKKTKKKQMAQRTFKEKIEWDMMAVSMIASGLMFTLYFLTFLEFYWNNTEGAALRWSGTSVASTHAIIMHISCSLYEACTYVLTGKQLMFYLHHVVVIGNCGTMLLANRCHLWCAWLGLVEGTNVPLCSLTLMQTTSLKGSMPYVLSGVSLWISYVILRVVGAPMCIYTLWQDTLNAGEEAWIVKDKDLNTSWFVFLYVSAAFLWGLSMYWFYLITKGLLKAIGGGSKKKSA